ncbi:MMPL family transporter [Nocardia sp. NPDC101769]|uniref:MMPL family transporter n=1 Tax=Nocardia sp. NPDC101769 TaxID=3364333 RepID=UPI00381AF64B
MLNRVARSATAGPRVILLIAALIMLACGGLGASTIGHLKSGGYVPDNAESQRAERFLHERFPGAEPNLALVVGSVRDVDDPAVRTAGEQLVERLSRYGQVSGVQSYWSMRPDLADSLRSHDRHRALILAVVAGDQNEAQRRAKAIADELSGSTGDITVTAGGAAVFVGEMTDRITHDLMIAELVAIPVSGILLALVFGSVVAAALPVMIGLFSIATTLGILRAFTLVTDVSVFALNMSTALGLALAIDYALLIVSRYREELANDLEPRAAVIRVVRTAGRTVVFSAVTVAMSLTALLLFDQYFLRSFAYAGIAVVAAAAVAAIVILPACLILLGPAVNAWDLRKLVRRMRTDKPPGPPEHSWWYRMVVVVMRHATPVALATIALLLLLASPILGLRLGYPDDRALPDSASSRAVGDVLRTDFDPAPGTDLVIALPGFSGGTADLGAYAARLSALTDIRAVLSADGVYVHGARVAPGPDGLIGSAGSYLSLQSAIDPYSRAGAAQLAAVRAVAAPVPALYGGTMQTNADTIHTIEARLPAAALVIAATTLIVLFLFTGSVVLPLKAIVLNVLSLSATFGAMVWIFQDGHVSGVLDFTPTGYINAGIPVLMFCLAFGMSMDYEVFLLSRIREEWLASDRGVTANTRSVALGVYRTGWIFTAAAGLMAVVFLAVGGSHISFMQLFGIGLALAVLTDATLIRLLLVPSLMQLMGKANWWSPKPLARLHARIGVEESLADPAAAHSETPARGVTA